MSEVSQAVATGVHRIDKDASSNQDPHAEFQVPMSTYLAIFIALMVLLVITVVAAFLPLGQLNMIVAMTIATIKAVLVILYFMHVKFASRLTKVFVAAAFVWLAIMFVLTFADYVSRDWLSNSRGWNDNPVKSAYDAGVARDGHGGGSAHAESKDNTGGKHTGDPAAGEAHDPTTPHDPAAAPGKPGAGG
jgi:cytochrome c oxidase subunit 4